MKTLYQFFEDKLTESMGSDIVIKQFNIEYYALDPNTVADVITAKEQVSNTGAYHLRTFVHDLAKTIAQKQQGEVTINFAMEDLVRKKEYLIEIKYTHVNKIKINESIITSKEKILFNKIKDSAPKSFPEKTFIKLIYLIYYSLKGVLKTENYTKK